MFDQQPDLLTFSAPESTTKPISRYMAIKAEGGPAYDLLLERNRAASARFHEKHPGQRKYGRRRWKEKNGNSKSFKAALCSKARARGRKRGIEATITPADLHWPTHCPVLGIKLSYPKRTGQRGLQHIQPNWPSLDRYEPAKGYVAGNVFVISFRANTLKSNATYEEILKVAKYLARRPRHV